MAIFKLPAKSKAGQGILLLGTTRSLSYAYISSCTLAGLLGDTAKDIPQHP